MNFSCIVFGKLDRIQAEKAQHNPDQRPQARPETVQDRPCLHSRQNQQAPLSVKSRMTPENR